MKHLALFTGLLCLSTLAVSAAPCTVGSLQSYISLSPTGCTVGNDIFTGFVTVPGQFGATPVAASSVTVTPGGTAANPNFTFSFGQTAVNAQLFESIFRFKETGGVTVANITLNSPSATGNGAVTGVLDVCRNANFTGTSPTGCPTGGLNATAEFDVLNSILSSSVNTPNATSLDVFVDLTVDGGGTGTASLRSATVTFATPEPSSMALVLFGVTACAWFARKRSSKSLEEIV